MTTIPVTETERLSRTLTPEHRETAVRAIETDGFVVLADVVSPAHLAHLHTRLLEDLEVLLRRPDTPYNWNSGNIQQDPPPFPPYLYRDILVNDQVIAVTSALLGDAPRNTLYSGNTALPGETRQPVHADLTHLWPRLPVAHPPAQLVVNIPTVDVSSENGSTELWPGTHGDVTVTAGKDIKIPAAALEARRVVRPPLQPVVRVGSALIRDARLWHAGMPNHTRHPRPMLAMIHGAGWLETGEPLRFAAGAEEHLRHPVLRTHAVFVEGPIDHIGKPQGYEYKPG